MKLGYGYLGVAVHVRTGRIRNYQMPLALGVHPERHGRAALSHEPGLEERIGDCQSRPVLFGEDHCWRLRRGGCQNNAQTTFPVTTGQAATLCGAASNNVAFTAS